jgi:hypothetical protein
MNIRARLIVDELARHRVQFEHLCRSLTADELATQVPDSHWTVRDYIAHLCTIDGLIAAGLGPRFGVTVPLPDVPRFDPFDIDDWNDAAIRARSSATIDELLDEARRHRENLLTSIVRLTDADLDREVTIGGDRKVIDLPRRRGRYGGTLWAIAIHDPTHTLDIVRALPHRAEQGWVRDWLGSFTDVLVPEGVKEWRA